MPSPDLFAGRIELTAVDADTFLETVPKHLSTADIEEARILQIGARFILLFEEIKEDALFKLKALLRPHSAGQSIAATTFGEGTPLVVIERNAGQAITVAATEKEEAQAEDIDSWLIEEKK